MTSYVNCINSSRHWGHQDSKELTKKNNIVVKNKK